MGQHQCGDLYLSDISYMVSFCLHQMDFMYAVLVQHHILNAKCILKNCNKSRRRWNRTTRLLHLYRFEVCTPHQRRSSTLKFNLYYIMLTQAGFEPASMWIKNTAFIFLETFIASILNKQNCFLLQIRMK